MVPDADQSTFIKRIKLISYGSPSAGARACDGALCGPTYPFGTLKTSSSFEMSPKHTGIFKKMVEL